MKKTTTTRRSYTQLERDMAACLMGFLQVAGRFLEAHTPEPIEDVMVRVRHRAMDSAKTVGTGIGMRYHASQHGERDDTARDVGRRD